MDNVKITWESQNTRHLSKIKTGAFLVAQWQRITLPMQETQVRPLIHKIPRTSEQLSPCSTRTEPALESPGAARTEPALESPGAAWTEPAIESRGATRTEPGLQRRELHGLSPLQQPLSSGAGSATREATEERSLSATVKGSPAPRNQRKALAAPKSPAQPKIN